MNKKIIFTILIFSTILYSFCQNQFDTLINNNDTIFIYPLRITEVNEGNIVPVMTLFPDGVTRVYYHDLIKFNLFRLKKYTKKKNKNRIACELYAKDGMKNGPITCFNEKNNIIYRGFYKNNLKDGIWTSYNENGIMYEQAEYKEGIRNGLSYSYNYFGELNEKTNFIENKKNGEYLRYKNKSAEYNYYWQKHNKSDNFNYLHTYGHFKEDMPIGNWIEYFPNGNILATYSFSDSNYIRNKFNENVLQDISENSFKNYYDRHYSCFEYEDYIDPFHIKAFNNYIIKYSKNGKPILKHFYRDGEIISIDTVFNNDGSLREAVKQSKINDTLTITQYFFNNNDSTEKNEFETKYQFNKLYFNNNLVFKIEQKIKKNYTITSIEYEKEYYKFNNDTNTFVKTNEIFEISKGDTVFESITYALNNDQKFTIYTKFGKSNKPLKTFSYRYDKDNNTYFIKINYFDFENEQKFKSKFIKVYLDTNNITKTNIDSVIFYDNNILFNGKYEVVNSYKLDKDNKIKRNKITEDENSAKYNWDYNNKYNYYYRNLECWENESLNPNSIKNYIINSHIKDGYLNGKSFFSHKNKNLYVNLNNGILNGNAVIRSSNFNVFSNTHYNKFIETSFINDTLNGKVYEFSGKSSKSKNKKTVGIYNFINNKLDGEFKQFNEKGILTLKGEFENGYPIESFNYYDDNGRNYRNVYFKNNSLIRDVIYHSVEDKLIKDIQIKGKIYIGFDKYYDNENKLRIEFSCSIEDSVFYYQSLKEEAMNGHYKIYRNNGNLFSEGSRRKGKRIEKWNFYDEDQNLIKTITYFTKDSIIDDSKIMGSLEIYNSKKQKLLYAYITDEIEKYSCESITPDYDYDLKYINCWTNDNKQIMSNGTGTLIMYHPNGNIAQEGEMINFKKENNWKEYDPNGKLIGIGKYINDKKEGRWLYGNLDGYKFIDQLCFLSPEEFKKTIEMTKNLIDISEVIYKNGEMLFNMNYNESKDGKFNYEYYDYSF